MKLVEKRTVPKALPGMKFLVRRLRSLLDRYLLRTKENSFTRGIGTEKGLEDLVASGVVRGNPKGTGMTPKLYNKVRFKGRNKEFWEPLLAKHPDILNHYYNLNLTEEEWKSLKRAVDEASKDFVAPKEGEMVTLLAANRSPILLENETYENYLKNGEGHFQLTWDEWHPEELGNPPAYFYNDGRNMFGNESYEYAKSKYGVRLNNASEYEPYIPEGHIHYSVKKPITLDDPNVEVFRRGPFGIALKMDKDKLIEASLKKKAAEHLSEELPMAAPMEDFEITPEMENIFKRYFLTTDPEILKLDPSLWKLPNIKFEVPELKFNVLPIPETNIRVPDWNIEDILRKAFPENYEGKPLITPLDRYRKALQDASDFVNLPSTLNMGLRVRDVFIRMHPGMLNIPDLRKLEYKPFLQTRILPSDEYERILKGVLTNGGFGERSGGLYSPADNTVYLRSDITEGYLRPIGFHEYLHALGFGGRNALFNRSRLERLLNYDLMKKRLGEDSLLYKYYTSTVEAPVHFLLTGYAAGLWPGMKYPGYNTFKSLIDSKSMTPFGSASFVKLETPRDYKRYWDAITGLWFYKNGGKI